MKKLRYYLAAIALAATLSGPAFLGIGVGSIANAASSQHVSSTFMAGKLATSAASRRYPPCPGSTTYDC